MFAQALKSSQSAAAQAPATRPAPKQPGLSNGPHDGTLGSFLNKRPLATTPQAQFKTKFLPPKPNQSHAASTTASSKSTATMNRSASTYPPQTRSGLVSLCGKSDSFTDGPPAATVSSKIAVADENTLKELGFSLDDFDDELDMDISIPSAMPPKPAAASTPLQQQRSMSTSSRNNSGFVDSPPLSPSENFAPAPAQSSLHPTTTNTRSVAAPKRASSEVIAIEDDDDSPLPVAKKRTLPRDWTSSSAKTNASNSSQNQAHSYVSQMHAATVSATPAPKQSAMWDASASAIKTQKKQLKDQTKKQAQQVLDADADAKAAIIEKVKELPKPAGPVVLSNEQQHVKNLVVYKKASVFFTGPAGTGKSVLMRAIIDDLRVKYAKDPEQLGICASTGLAACNIGGMTLHSFSGIGLGKEDAATLVRKIRMSPKARNRWIKTKTLVIDEVSMLDGDLFDKLSQIGRTIRKNARPWGGIQLVLTGDFFQLPPVPDREKRDVKFAFEANTWKTSIDHTIGLTEVFRQRDPEFAGMLNEMRLGRISDKTVETFKAMARPLHFDDELEVTELFPTRQEVENSNERRLRSLKGKAYVYEALDSGDAQIRDKLLQNMMAPKRLELRVGAQVMLIKNMDETLVNGSLGTIKKFMTESEYVMDDTESSLVDAEAKKRATILNSYLNKDGAGSGVSSSSSRPYPYVEFHGANGQTRGILVRSEEWKSELPNGVVQASRSQLPLILAWALSIHKAQGQTLDRVKVDLGKVFEKGQAYVALSRATTKQGLQVLRFEKHKVMAHPKVVEFYGQLSSAESALKNKAGDASILAFTKRSSVKLEDKAPTRRNKF